MTRAGTDGAAALDSATSAADDTTDALNGAGAAGTAACNATAAGAEAAKPGWAAVTAALSDYASKAKDIWADVGQAIVGAFQSAEDAVGEFVKTGKLNFGDLVTSILADLAKLAVRKSVLGPIADMLSGALGGIGGIFAPVLHSGGMVGSTTSSRMIPALAFSGAPRMHSGGWAGLRPDEVPAILQKGERVLSRRELASQGGQAGGGGQNIAVTINARDAQSFRQSRVQVASDIARAVAFGRRAF